MLKNTAGKWIVFAFGRTSNSPVTGDALNITANLRLDGGVANPIDDTNPTELEGGYYYFDLTAAETNADLIAIIPVSATPDVIVIGIPGAVYTETVSQGATKAELDAAEAALTALISKVRAVVSNRLVVDPATGAFTIYADDGVTVLVTGTISDTGRGVPTWA